MSRTKINWNKILHRLHIYGGLVCMVYLMIVGMSVLNFQHKFLPEQPIDTVSYTRTIEFDSSLKIDTLSKFIRDELGIKGHLPPWEFRENKQGLVRFTIERPARTFEVKLNRNSTLVNVGEVHYSAGKILRALHFGSIRNQLGYPISDMWSLYGQVSALFAFLAIATGIWFWFKHAVKNRKQWFAIILSGFISIIYIAYIWLVG